MAEKSTPVMVRLPDELVEAVDTYRRGQPEIPSRPEVVRQVLAQWVKSQGLHK